MDTTEKYIKMVDSPEIQGEWKPKRIDAVIIRQLKNESTHYSFPSGVQHLREKQPDPYTGWYICSDHIHYMIGRFLWLPRQDQLQEMTKIDTDYRFDSFPYACIYYLDEFLNRELPHISSMEQLWLAFVMHEKHGKMWDDKNENWTTPSYEKIP